jgi:hypothetical protein
MLHLGAEDVEARPDVALDHGEAGRDRGQRAREPVGVEPGAGDLAAPGRPSGLV